MAQVTACARDSDWCDGVICRERGIDCPKAEPVCDEPVCEHCGDEADMFTEGRYVCDQCDDEHGGTA